MAVLEIVKIGNDVLKQRAESVKKLTKRNVNLIENMIETMYEADGVGLAAPQVGISLRIIVVDIGEGPLCLINPKIIKSEGEEIDVEGCLSIPETNGYVKRAKSVVVEYINEKGKPAKIKAEGLLTRALQHEIDHLDGMLFIDKLVDPPIQENQEKEENQEGA